MQKINIKRFDKWALSGKDQSMEKGHTPSVNKMIEIISNKNLLNNKNFNFLDLGCGNGWVVRKFSQNKFCNLAIGIDASKNMINNAKKNTINEIYIKADIENWQYDEKFDIIFSMETLYYIKDIDNLVRHIYQNLLNNNGAIIMGIDYYLENKASLSWGEDYNLSMLTLSVDEWKEIFISNKFKNIEISFFGKRKKWNGTMILYAEKK